ncbi:MAG: hypothetical protein IPO49_18210 [Bacteroidetes bacterium]|nr:hypothetical protein [Bacteroidota bacterium]
MQQEFLLIITKDFVDTDNNRLLVACKSKLGKGAEFKDKRVIYGFDLSTKKLSSEPVFSFDIATIKAFAQEKIKPTCKR